MDSQSNQKAQKGGGEKRKGVRVSYNGDTLFRQKKGEPSQALVRDVSETGISIITSEILPIEEPIFLELPLIIEGKNKFCRVSSTVVRSIVDPRNEQMGYGLQFSNFRSPMMKKILADFVAQKKGGPLLQNSEESFARLLEVSRELQIEEDLRQISERIVKLVMELIVCERVALYRMEGDHLVTLASRNLEEENILELANLGVSGGKLFKKLNQPFLCAPFAIGKEFNGTLYVDRLAYQEPFTAQDSMVLDAISKQAATAMERVLMGEEVRKQQEKIRYLYDQLYQKNEEKVYFQSKPEKAKPNKFPGIIGTSTKMKNLLETISQASSSDAPVYIYGESGTGKELVARALHSHSNKKDQAFVTVQCGTIPSNLFESFFFGHVKGAFTGADQDQVGIFSQANGGVLFLDEIDALPLDTQAKLLRVLEESKVRPVGGLNEFPISVRIITASNRDLDELVTKGSFREDLYYRLHVIRIEVPALRERAEDISILAQHFLKNACTRQGISEPVFDEAALSALMNYGWPGNVRQLKNEIDRIMALLPKSGQGRQVIQMEMLSHDIIKSRYSVSASGSLAKMLDKFARDSIVHTLEKHKMNKSHAAKELGLSRFGLRKMMRRLNIDSE